MFEWMTSRLHRRFLAGTAAGLLMSVLVFLLLFLGMYRAELGNERAGAATQVNQLLQTSLENAMLKRDLDGLRHIVAGLGRQDGIGVVMISNPSGEVRFSSDAGLLGQYLKGETPQEAVAFFTTDAQGREVLRSINPVHNKPLCGQCHGPVAQHPINGILYVDFDAATLRHKARSTTLLLMGTGALIVLLNISGGWWFIRRYVLRPVAALSRANTALSQGRLDARVELTGRDELARLGTAFNRMAENLQVTLRRLSEHEAFLQELVDAIPDGVRVIDNQHRVELVNRSYREQLGLGEAEAFGRCYEAPHGRKEPCAPTLMTCPLFEVTQSQGPVTAHHRHRRQDGSVLDVEIHASPMRARVEGKERFLVVESIRSLADDIKYSQEQKLSELGHLAAGVAHEIYNPLSSMRMAIHAARENLSSVGQAPTEVDDYLDIVEQEIQKCIEVTERLLKLSMPPAHDRELVDLNTALEDTLGLLGWEAKKGGIELIQDFQPGLRLLARDSELRMVALNLALNAFHAMPDGGRLTVSTRRNEGRIEIAFEDSGVGIAAAEQRRIFDPFYSRRANGVPGPGLGLSISRAIVEGHGGTIAVSSEPGVGSRFLIRMPDPDNPSGGA